MIPSPAIPPEAGEPPFAELEVVRKSCVARDIWCFELQHPLRLALTRFTAGSHLTVQVPGIGRRNYSLCGNPSDSHSYQIAIKRMAAGRGGSIAMAEQVHEGARLLVSAPRNNFVLHPRATGFLFIAGGIGITPILSMMRSVLALGQHPFQLVYCTRDAGDTAFLQELGGPGFQGCVSVHHDRGDPAQAFDFWPLLEAPGKTHVYCCGPRGLMDAVADMSGHWPSGSVHFESFGVAASSHAANAPFAVRLHKSGTVVSVAANQSILEALRDRDHHVPSSCESGTCGSCRTGLLAGVAEHRDMVLANDEKAHNIMVCVSRAKSAELVLDL